MKTKNRPARAAVSEPKANPIISERRIYASALAALQAEAVENGSARLTVFYTDGRATGYTTGHSRRRRAKHDK